MILLDTQCYNQTLRTSLMTINAETMTLIVTTTDAVILIAFMIALYNFNFSRKKV